MPVPIEVQIEELTTKEVQSIKSLWRGDADSYQQRLALQLITNKLSRTHDLMYVPESERASVFLAGRSFVGLQILKLLKMPVARLVTEGSPDVED